MWLQLFYGLILLVHLPNSAKYKQYILKHSSLSTYLLQCRDGEFVLDESERPANKGVQASVAIWRSPATNQKYFFKSHRARHVFRLERSILPKLAEDQATPRAVCYTVKPERGIVMELAAGGDLYADSWYHPQNPLRFQSYQQLVHAAAHLVASLASLHSRGYLHNDLRPNNVIFSHPHRLQVIDFGLSRRIGKKGFHSRCVLNSPPETAYLSTAKDRYQKINSTASDWYTAGVLIHFFLAKGLFCIQPDNFEDGACAPGLQEMFWPYQSRSVDPQSKSVTYKWTPQPPVPLPSDVKHFLGKLIVVDPLQRDFRGKKLVKELLEHPLFVDIDWNLINPRLLQQSQQK